jgi:hypothetical protein
MGEYTLINNEQHFCLKFSIHNLENTFLWLTLAGYLNEEQFG